MPRAYQLGLYEKAMPIRLSWEEKFDALRQAGFDFLELSIDETDDKLARLDWTETEVNHLRHLIEKTQTPIVSMCLSGHRKYPLGHPDPAMQSRSLEIMEKALQLSVKLGVRYIQLAGYDVYYENSTPETLANFDRNLRRAVDLAAKYGVPMGFETMETAFMDTVGKAMHYVNQIKSPYLGVYPDIGNLMNASVLYGTPYIDDLYLGRGHIFAAHLKETIPGHFREIPYGTGHTDYQAALKACHAMGINLFVGESWDLGEENWRELLAYASGFLREKIDAVYSEQGN